MTLRRIWRGASFTTLAVTAVLSLSAIVTAAAAQDSLARARELYDQAAYEEALVELEKMSGSSGPSTEIAAYQVFCLVALGRSAEATQAITSIVKADPLFRPSESQASPRVRAFFEDVRRPLLPDIARQTYARAKTAFDRKDMRSALADFDRTIGLLDELGSKEGDGAADLLTLAVSFRDLARLATPANAPGPAPAPAPPPPATVAASPAATPATARSSGNTASVVEVMGPVTATSSSTAAQSAEGPRVYGTADTGVQKPVAVTRPLPIWQPRTPVEAKQSFHGVLELVIDEQGRVTRASLLQPVHPVYDPVLLKAIQEWKFRPAIKDGQPVKYRYTADINLGPAKR